jgi:ABC-2 type transport system permease protein
MTATMAPAASPLAGTGALIRFALRRDRVRLSAWMIGLSLYTAVVASSFPGIYPGAAQREARAVLMGSPGAIAFGGPKIGFNDYTLGAMMTNEMLGLTAVVVALVNIFLVVRHTRADEESGRTELVLASPVGRGAPLAAALAVATIANLLLATLTAVGLGALGIQSIGWAGSVLYGAALGMVGLVFAATAAVMAQLTQHGRSASGLAGLALGVAFALRAVGDISASPLSWLSPIGWAQRTYAYVDDRWWPLLIGLAVAVLLAAVAARLGARRDLGSGLRQPRPGPGAASDALATPIGLAARLQRGALIGWIVALFAFGLLYGSLLGNVESFAKTLQSVNDMLGGLGTSDFVSGFVALLASLFAMVGSIYAVIATLRPQAEERAGRAEAVLATPVARGRYLLSHAGVAAAGGTAIVLAGALGMGVTGSAVLGDAGVLRDVLVGSLVQCLALLLLVALAVALYGLVPGATGVVWAVVGYGFLSGMLGGLLGLPHWAMKISPFGLAPMLPAQDFAVWPVVGILAGAAVLVSAGVWGIRRRDLRYGG